MTNTNLQHTPFTPTQLQKSINFWQNKGSFNLNLYQKYLEAKTEDKPSEEFNEELTEGKSFSIALTYILIFILACIFLLTSNLF